MTVKIDRDLLSVLNEIKQDTKEIQKDIAEIKISIARLEEKNKSTDEIVRKIDGTQKAQIWALITLAFTSVLTFLAAAFKFIFFPNP